LDHSFPPKGGTGGYHKEGSMQRLARTLVLVALFGSVASAQQLPTASPESVGLSADRLDRMHKSMQGSSDTREAAGIVTLFADAGKVVDLKSYGLQDVEGKTPMRTDTIFRIASMSKAITTVGVMMLYEDGKLTLNDPVSKYIPSFKGQRVATVGANGS